MTTQADAVRTEHTPNAKREKWPGLAVGWFVGEEERAGIVEAVHPNGDAAALVVYRECDGSVWSQFADALDHAQPPRGVRLDADGIAGILGTGTAPDLKMLHDLADFMVRELRAAAGAARCRWGSRVVEVDSDTFRAAEGFAAASLEALHGLGQYLAEGTQPPPDDVLREVPIARYGEAEVVELTPAGEATAGHPLAGLACHDCNGGHPGEDFVVETIEGDTATLCGASGTVSVPVEDVVVWLRDVATFIQTRAGECEGVTHGQ